MPHHSDMTQIASSVNKHCNPFFPAPSAVSFCLTVWYQSRGVRKSTTCSYSHAFRRCWMYSLALQAQHFYFIFSLHFAPALNPWHTLFNPSTFEVLFHTQGSHNTHRAVKNKNCFYELPNNPIQHQNIFQKNCFKISRRYKWWHMIRAAARGH